MFYAFLALTVANAVVAGLHLRKRNGLLFCSSTLSAVITALCAFYFG